MVVLIPDMLVAVYGLDAPEGGPTVVFSCVVAGGQMAAGQVSIPWGASASATNNAVVEAAKALMTETFGVAFVASDRIMLFGGRV